MKKEKNLNINRYNKESMKFKNKKTPCYILLLDICVKKQK